MDRVVVSRLSVDFFFSSRRRHTRCLSDWSSDVCSSDLSSTPDCRASWPNGCSGGNRVGARVHPGALGVLLARTQPDRGEIGRASCRERGWIGGGEGEAGQKTEERAESARKEGSRTQGAA